MFEVRRRTIEKKNGTCKAYDRKREHNIGMESA